MVIEVYLKRLDLLSFFIHFLQKMVIEVYLKRLDLLSFFINFLQKIVFLNDGSPTYIIQH